MGENDRMEFIFDNLCPTTLAVYLANLMFWGYSKHIKLDK